LTLGALHVLEVGEVAPHDAVERLTEQNEVAIAEMVPVGQESVSNGGLRGD
jgi:hypothetical protein